MKVVLNTVSVTPHMVPFALELSKRLAPGDLVYIDRGSPDDPNRAVGVRETVGELLRPWTGSAEDNRLLREADILIQNIRDFDLMNDRARNGRLTVYQSERWFKPIKLPFADISVPGFCKMIAPFAIKRALSIFRLFKSGSFYYLPLGVHAARDMARLCGLLNFDLRCLFRAPRIRFEQRAGGRIFAEDGCDKRYCLDKMRMWGYFVFPSELGGSRQVQTDVDVRRVLWVGRLLKLKRVDDIVRAVKILNGTAKTAYRLTIIGDGPDKERLQQIAKDDPNVVFAGSVPLRQVRSLMRENDVYVFSSNQHEGWGAVVNEAMEEGMSVVGTVDAGASVTMLPPQCVYKSGDVRRLVEILSGNIEKASIENWSAKTAAESFMKEFVK